MMQQCACIRKIATMLGSMRNISYAMMAILIQLAIIAKKHLSRRYWSWNERKHGYKIDESDTF